VSLGYPRDLAEASSFMSGDKNSGIGTTKRDGRAQPSEQDLEETEREREREMPAEAMP